MELGRIKILIDKYFEGVTSLEEEQEIAAYFAENDDIPEQFKSAKAMFEAFGKLRSEKPSAEVHTPSRSDRRVGGITLNRRWWAGVAASVVLIMGASIAILNSRNADVERVNATTPEFVCHINGVRVEDEQLAYAEMDRILANVSNDIQVAMVEIDNITNYTKMR